MPAIKKKSMPRIADEIATDMANMKTAATAKWREWARDLAAGGPSPNPRDVIEAALTLGIVEPGQALESDAKVIAEVHRLEQRSARDRAARVAALDPYGGEKGITELIQARRTELAELERLASPWAAMASASSDQQAGRLRRINPRLFD